MPLPAAVTISEEGPREGFQIEPGPIPTERKVELIDALSATGLQESAWIDGCSRIGALWRIVLPSVIPGVIAVGAINFMAAWNEFLFALVFISSERFRTLPLGLSLWIGEDVLFNWGMLLAAAVVMTVPVLAVYLLVQRHLVSGLTEGSVKG